MCVNVSGITNAKSLNILRTGMNKNSRFTLTILALVYYEYADVTN